MPALLDRMSLFCLDMDTETEPQDLVDLVRVLFISGDTRLGLWAGVLDGTLVGHLLATPEPWGGTKWKYCLIRQAQVDCGIDNRAESKAVFSEVKAWTQKLGLSQINMLTHRSEASMARRWGFSPFKVYMKLDLAKET